MTLSLLHWLLLGNFFMLLVVAGFMCLLRNQQQRDGHGYTQQISQLHKTQVAINDSTVGLGRRLKMMEGRLREAEQQSMMPNVDDAKFAQASRLVGLGASASDLVDSCGVARGEAELLVSMRRRAG